jgi:hypothetical protein
MARHIVTNGDHAATALAAHFPDAEILIWRDVLVEGPVPGEIDDEVLADVRASYIQRAFGMLKDGVRDDFRRRDDLFEQIAGTDELELWFETDLHDQLQLIQFLDRASRRSGFAAMRLAMAVPPLSSAIDAMAGSLQPIGPEELSTAGKLWNAFRERTPAALFEAAHETGSLPEARASLRRLIQEYPSTRDGLGLIERRALLALRDGAVTPGLAFRHYQQTEALPFLGDLGFYDRLQGLALGPHPLISGLPEGGIAAASENSRTLEYTYVPISLTPAGEAVLDGEADRVALNGIDRWIGGVHLTPETLWRFDGNRLQRG